MKIKEVIPTEWVRSISIDSNETVHFTGVRYGYGSIDKDGKLLRKRNTLKTQEEKKSFTLLHRLIFNLKRILHKIPVVRSKIGTYATALYLLKQHFAGQVEDEDTIEMYYSTKKEFLTIFVNF